MAMVGVDSGSLYRRTHSLSRLARSWVGGRLAPFYIHQMNWVNSRNGSATMTAPWTLSWILLLLLLLLFIICAQSIYDPAVKPQYISMTNEPTNDLETNDISRQTGLLRLLCNSQVSCNVDRRQLRHHVRKHLRNTDLYNRFGVAATSAPPAPCWRGGRRNRLV